MQPSNTLLALLCAFSMAFVACNQNTPDDTKKGGDTPTSQHQPSDPATWSPAGHIYIYETTYKNSSAPDKYWVWVLDFFGGDSVIWYETDHRDLTYNGSPAYERTTYELNYPKLLLHIDTGREVTFIDTTTIDASWWDIVYEILR